MCSTVCGRIFPTDFNEPFSYLAMRKSRQTKLAIIVIRRYPTKLLLRYRFIPEELVYCGVRFGSQVTRDYRVSYLWAFDRAAFSDRSRTVSIPNTWYCSGLYLKMTNNYKWCRSRVRISNLIY